MMTDVDLDAIEALIAAGLTQTVADLAPALVAEVRRLRAEVVASDEGRSVSIASELEAIAEREKLRSELREVTAERDFLKRREQSIIEATEPADGGQYRADIVSAIQRQRRDLEKAREENERLRVQLASCGVVANDGSSDHEAEPGSYGWSPAYGDVLRSRRDLDKAREEARLWKALAEVLNGDCSCGGLARGLVCDRCQRADAAGAALHQFLGVTELWEPAPPEQG